MEANHTYCLTISISISISIISCRQKEFCLVVALSVRLLGLAPWSDTYPDGIAQPWIRCSNIEFGNGIEGDMLIRSRCRKRDSPTSLMFPICNTAIPSSAGLLHRTSVVLCVAGSMCGECNVPIRSTPICEMDTYVILGYISHCCSCMGCNFNCVGPYIYCTILGKLLPSYGCKMAAECLHFFYYCVVQ